LGVRAVLATAGADGAVLETEAGKLTAPIAALPGRVVDTVGAGDATLAGVAEGLVDGHPSSAAEWQALLDRAMLIAAATVRSEGGLLRTPESLAESERGVFGS
ncbi:MAG TPA: PfkB family carbohydrate kinase, partial [Microbacterium sp.]|nr:PfkB family carbohydrate kinase [Microbacterium sp.]